MTQRLRRRFRIMTLFQVLLLAGTLALLGLTLMNTRFVAVPALIACLAALQAYLLLRSVQAHVDALEEFFAAINYQDFTRRFQQGELDGELAEAFNRIIARFRDARVERDLQAGYLDTVVRHVPVPLIAVRADGQLSIVNHPARRLTGLNQWTRLGQLDSVADGLSGELAGIPAGSQRLLQVQLRGVPVELRVSVSEIRREGDVERLYAIENLSGELTAREGSAWRNLIRVLTHEMMNTLTPVTSLAQTANDMLDEPDAKDDIREALATIERRGNGLMRFVSRYREFMQVPRPQFATLSVTDLVNGVLSLERPLLEQVSVRVAITPETLAVDGDRELLEQVLVNIVKNAIEAMQHTAEPCLEVTAGLESGRVVLCVADNGSGIPEDVRDQVFIPFFTTRKTGSGIGLSLSRQIMNAHGGDIVIEPRAEGTSIRLLFG